MQLDVSLISPKEIIFEGKAKSIILPGESGVFEVLPMHHRLLSRLVSGVLFIDEQSYRVRRGMVKVIQNKVTILIEEAV
ncbi:MAG: F0F1 ATP synthase subunit epsilon [Candidatus Omnitrophica bacterium]|nr:F0F1 ATP synthase subunit epsilon [Candidatus Omnitrophota bacterium]